MKTNAQLREMYRDIMGCRCIPVEIEYVCMFIDYCRKNYGLALNGGAISADGKYQYLYIG